MNSQISPETADELEILRYILSKNYMITVLVHQLYVKMFYTNVTRGGKKKE